MKEVVSKSEEETQKIAADFAKASTAKEDFASSLEPAFAQSYGEAKATVVGLYGELGAGKTSFMKGVAKHFGINDTIQSPTFVIEKIYEIPDNRAETIDNRFKHLIHIDAYRIEKSDEMINLGWNEIISDSRNLIFVEWPERIADIMSPHHTKIFFSHLQNPNERKIKIYT